MKVIVCGGRDFKGAVTPTLNAIFENSDVNEPLLLIHGGAKGADELASDYAYEIGSIQEVHCPANWDKLGRKAGVIRNSMMLELKPDLVVAFPGGNGTKDMIQKALHANIRVLTV